MAKFHAEQERAILEEVAKQSAVLSCQSCKKETLVPIRLDDNNTFSCDHCDTINAVYIDMDTAVITTPLESLQTIRINESRANPA